MKISETIKRCATGLCEMLVLVMLMIACHKDPTPTPTPEPEPTPSPDTTQVIDTTKYPDTIWFSVAHLFVLPPMDSVEFYASKSSVKKIILELETYNSTGWRPTTFKRAKDSLQLRIDVNPQKVRGAGTIYTYCIRPDSITTLPGMHRGDSIALTQMGFDIKLHWDQKSKQR